MISLILKQREFVYKFLMVVSVFVALFALTISVIYLKPTYLPYKTSFDIAVSTLKVKPIFGIGSGNYIESFYK